MASDPNQPAAARRIPSRRWYVLAAVLLLGSLSVFILALKQKADYLSRQIAPMPRFVAPTDGEGFTVTIDEPGKQNLFYENRGEFDGKAYHTHRRQVWTTFESPAMACEVVFAQTGEPVELRLPGEGEAPSKSQPSKDQVITYDTPRSQGHTVWVFDAEQAGDYRVQVRYVDRVAAKPGSIVIPPELTKAQKKQMLEADGEIYEATRREAIERAALAELEPVDVLFAVGPDPTRGTFFEVIGLKGAAAVLAFGFTFSVLILLVVFMLRAGHVTPRGELADIKRGLGGRSSA